MKIRSKLISHSFVVLLLITLSLENLDVAEDRNRTPKIDSEYGHINRSLFSPIGPGAVLIFPVDRLPTSIRSISFDEEVDTPLMMVRAKATSEKGIIFSAFLHIFDSLTTSPQLKVNSRLQRIEMANAPQTNPFFPIDLLSNYFLARFSHRLAAARLKLLTTAFPAYGLRDGYPTLPSGSERLSSSFGPCCGSF